MDFLIFAFLTGSHLLPCSLAEQQNGSLPFAIQRCTDTICIDMCKLAEQNPTRNIPLDQVDICLHCPESLRDEAAHLDCQDQVIKQNGTLLLQYSLYLKYYINMLHYINPQCHESQVLQNHTPPNKL